MSLSDLHSDRLMNRRRSPLFLNKMGIYFRVAMLSLSGPVVGIIVYYHICNARSNDPDADKTRRASVDRL